MKKNIYLRAALALLVGVWATTCLLGEATWAKYVAGGTGSDSARYAAFDFMVGSCKYNRGGKSWSAKNNTSDYWDQIVVIGNITSTSPTAETFTVPMFDWKYKHNASGATTVESNGDLVVAPGVGHHVDFPLNNPNYGSIYGGVWNDGGDNGGTNLYYKNNSEVTVRYRVLYDAANSNVRGIPFYIRGDGACPWFRTDQATGLKVVTDTSAGQPANSGWRVLAPNTAEMRQICWDWAFESSGVWHGLAVGSDYPNDAFDTALGKAAAAGSNTDIKLAFRLEVEQVD